jgi:hypothetical protein
MCSSVQEHTPELIEAATAMTPATAEISTPPTVEDSVLLTPISGAAAWTAEAAEATAAPQDSDFTGPTSQVSGLQSSNGRMLAAPHTWHDIPSACPLTGTHDRLVTPAHPVHGTHLAPSHIVVPGWLRPICELSGWQCRYVAVAVAVSLTEVPLLLQARKALAAPSPASRSEVPAISPIGTSLGTAACQMVQPGLSEEGVAATCPGTPAATPYLQQDEPLCPPTVPIVPASPATSAAEPSVSGAAAANAAESAPPRTHCIDATADVASDAAAAAAQTPPASQSPAQQLASPAGSMAAVSAQQPEAIAAAARCPPLSLIIVPPNGTPEVGWYMLWQAFCIMFLYSEHNKLRTCHAQSSRL